MKKFIFFSAIALWLFVATGCNKQEMRCDIALDVIKISNNAKVLLDSIISNKNTFLRTNLKDSLNIFVVNSKTDFKKKFNTDIDIDFDTITIISGVVRTASISDKIDELVLYQCNTSEIFKLDISILIAKNGWTQIGYLYFWKAYPKINMKKFSTTIKYK